uniref:Metallo-beta-lactamase domain-containing protein 1 n=1 Tax=Meloidogyne enterolobii TaxID=390850 RepID=A0A6V7Y0H2_MELEN|nr:unnamed protein product [Meloidogyne enterolobii]
MSALEFSNKISQNPIILQDLNFKISQIIIGNVQLDLHPKKENLPFCLNNFDFVGAKCSVTLIEKIGENFKMIVDCASPFEKEQLFEALKLNGINDLSQITHLVITHWHIDHCGLINLFKNAKLITPENINLKDFNQIFEIPKNINFNKYSGHSCGDLIVCINLNKNNLNISGLVDKKYFLKEKENFNILICGDIFEFENDWLGEEIWKSSSLLPDRQSIARWLCWNKSDFIIPGHGPGFSILEKEYTSQGPVFGKIFFESDKIPISPQKSKIEIKELLQFNVSIKEKHLLSIYIYLIKSINLNILVNTGGIEQRNCLIKALNSENLSPSSINFVIISCPGEHFCGNLADFPTSTIFMCTDIAVPGPFYATFDHIIILLFLDEDGQISVWRDLRTDSSDKCVLSILVDREGEGRNFDFIGVKIDEYLLTRFGLNEENILIRKTFYEIPKCAC